jgi:hypothetical protein
MFLLVVVLPVHVSCMFLLVVVLSVHVSYTKTKRNIDRQYNDQKKHGQAIQRPKETWTDNTTTKGNMDRQYNFLVFVLPVHVSFGRCIACPCFFWSLYCLSMFLLVVVLSVDVSFGLCIAKKHGQTIQRPKDTWTGNTTTKRNMNRQNKEQKKHGRSLYCLSMFLLVVVLSVDVSFGLCIACPCFFWSLYCLSMFLLVVVLPVHVSLDNTTTKRNMDR